jgi:hypothetical protein
MQPKSPKLANVPAAYMLVHSAAAAYIMAASAAQHRKTHRTPVHLLTICCLHVHTCNQDRAGSPHHPLGALNTPIEGVKAVPRQCRCLAICVACQRVRLQKEAHTRLQANFQAWLRPSESTPSFRRVLSCASYAALFLMLKWCCRPARVWACIWTQPGPEVFHGDPLGFTRLCLALPALYLRLRILVGGYGLSNHCGKAQGPAMSQNFPLNLAM